MYDKEESILLIRISQIAIAILTFIFVIFSYSSQAQINNKTAEINQGLPNWSPYKFTQSKLMTLTSNNGAMIQADSWHEHLNLVETIADLPMITPEAVKNLVGSTWQLVQFQGSDDTTLVAEEQGKYTLTFEANGSMRVRIDQRSQITPSFHGGVICDCNRGSSTWTSVEPNQLLLGQLTLTRAKCPPDLLYDRLVKDWNFIRSYVLKDNRLFLSLMADGGIYEFEKISS